MLYPMPLMLAAFYGLGRSEALGLKWDAVDLDRNTITIKHTVTERSVDGKLMLIRQDRTKTKSSTRTLPLVSAVRYRLLELRAERVGFLLQKIRLRLVLRTAPPRLLTKAGLTPS